MAKKRKKGYCGSRTQTRLRSGYSSVGATSEDPSAIEKVQNRGLNELKSQIVQDGFMYKPTDPSLRKLSEVLLEFVSDVHNLEAPISEQRKLLLYAVTVWNQEVLASSERSPSDRQRFALKAIADCQRELLPQVFDLLIAKKRQDYPSDKRLIQKIDVSEENGHLFVNVASVDLSSPGR